MQQHPPNYDENRLSARDPALFWARLPGDTIIFLGMFHFLYDMVAKRFT